MDINVLKNIPHLKNAASIVELTKGFSYDKKFIIDQKYLLRCFSSEDKERRNAEFETVRTLAAYSNYVPEGIEFNSLPGSDISYMLLTYMPGEDGETALKKLKTEEQYSAGVSSGKELKKLHRLSAPEGYPSWFSVKKKKSDNYLKELKKLDVDGHFVHLLEVYIKENESLMKNRPNRFQHDDFHPSNILIDRNRFSGIIDFQRMDWGDPVHDLQKLGFFSKRISIPFTRGVVDGYHFDEETVLPSFWELYAFYSAVHIVSALVWGMKNSRSQFKMMLDYSYDVAKDHNHFKRNIPHWYS